jgi:hypothetical protein
LYFSLGLWHLVSKNLKRRSHLVFLVWPLVPSLSSCKDWRQKMQMYRTCALPSL